MNIWFFIILILAIALVLGPISMLRPSPAQQRKEKLRLYATKHGVRFSMRRLPALKTDMEQAATLPVYYLPLPPKAAATSEWILMRTTYIHEGNFHLEWDWQTDIHAIEETCNILKAYLPKLPSSVPAISSSSLGVCVFWQERENTEMLDLLIEMLTKLHQSEFPATE
jgi:hypothetical protein